MFIADMLPGAPLVQPSRKEGKYSLIGTVRQRMRLRRLSPRRETAHGDRARRPRTETAHVAWIKRFVRFHGLWDPRLLGEKEVTEFLTPIAVRERVSASTQGQALAALLFLYRHVIRPPLPWWNDVVRARRSARLPSVLTREEVRFVLVEGAPRSRAPAARMGCARRRRFRGASGCA